MSSFSSTTGHLGRVGARLAQAGTWVACCLSRGRRAPLGDDDIDQLVAEFGESRFAGGTLIFSQGDEAARIHVVRTGSVELSRSINGRRVVLQILQAGDVFGDVPAFLGEPEPFDARALEDCVILSLEASTLFVLLQTRPQVARRWFVSLAERMAGLQQRLGDLLAGGLEAQLASILLRDGGERRPVTLTQAQLALMLGAARTSVQRVLKQLEQDGFIDIGYRRIDVIDPDGLAALIGSGDK